MAQVGTIVEFDPQIHLHSPRTIAHWNVNGLYLDGNFSLVLRMDV